MKRNKMKQIRDKKGREEKMDTNKKIENEKGVGEENNEDKGEDTRV